MSMPQASRRIVIFLATFVVTGAVSFASLYVFTRLLPPSEYGLYSLAVTSGALLNAFFFQWMRLYLLRHWSEDLDGREKITSLTLLGLMASTVVCFLAFGLFCCVFPGAVADFKLPVLVLIPFVGCTQALYEVALAKTRISYQDTEFLKLSVWRSLLFLACGIVGLQLFPSSQSLLLVLVSSYLLSLLVYAARGRLHKLRTALRLCMRIERKELVAALGFSLPTVVSTTAFVALPFVSRAYMSRSATGQQLGTFVAASDFTFLVVTTAMLAINFAFFNRLVESFGKDGKSPAFSTAMGRHTLAIAGAGLGVCLVAMACEPLISGHLLDVRYRDSAREVILINLVVAYVGGLRQFWFDHAYYLSKRTKHLAVASVLGLLANLALLWVSPFQSVQQNALFGTLAAHGVTMLCGGARSHAFFREFMHCKEVFISLGLLLSFLLLKNA